MAILAFIAHPARDASGQRARYTQSSWGRSGRRHPILTYEPRCAYVQRIWAGTTQVGSIWAGQPAPSQAPDELVLLSQSGRCASQPAQTRTCPATREHIYTRRHTGDTACGPRAQGPWAMAGGTEPSRAFLPWRPAVAMPWPSMRGRESSSSSWRQAVWVAPVREYAQAGRASSAGKEPTTGQGMDAWSFAQYREAALVGDNCCPACSTVEI
jgi:hypothetical protein